MTIDPGLFAEVADALGIDSPAIVEKDVYAVQLLSQLSQLDSPRFELVFAGGTSLPKANRSLYRMSEDSNSLNSCIGRKEKRQPEHEKAFQEAKVRPMLC